MDIHEYQAKEILARFGVPVPRGGLAYSPEQAGYRARELGGKAWVVKAQVHSGGRGAAGGVKLCHTADEVHEFAATLFGRQLVTKQTDANGKGVYRVWVEGASDIAQEIYLGFVLDRKSERIMIVASAHGGMEIEDLAETDPNSLRRMTIDPAVGLSEFQARELAFQLAGDVVDTRVVRHAAGVGQGQSGIQRSDGHAGHGSQGPGWGMEDSGFGKAWLRRG